MVSLTYKRSDKMNQYHAILIASFLSAASSVLVRYVTGMDMFMITLCVLFFASIFFFVVSVIKKERIYITHKKTLLIFGASQLGTWLFLYGALLLNPISVSMFLFYTSPILVILISPFLLNEGIHKMSILCIAIALIGTLFILNPFGGSEMLSTAGIIFALLAAVSYAANVIVGRKLRNDYSPFALSFLCHFIGFLILLFMIPLFSNYNGLSISNLIVLSSMGLLSGIGYGLIYYVLKTFVAQKAAILNLTEPVSATILGVLLFGEVPTIITIVGGGLILLGAALTHNIKQK